MSRLYDVTPKVSANIERCIFCQAEAVKVIRGGMTIKECCRECWREQRVGAPEVTQEEIARFKQKESSLREYVKSKGYATCPATWDKIVPSRFEQTSAEATEEPNVDIAEDQVVVPPDPLLSYPDACVRIAQRPDFGFFAHDRLFCIKPPPPPTTAP